MQRWGSTYTNARLGDINGLFRAAMGRRYRNTERFITMICLTASPAGTVPKST